MVNEVLKILRRETQMEKILLGKRRGQERDVATSYLWRWTNEKTKRESLEQGSPTPGPLTGSGPQPVRNQAAQQEVSGRPRHSPSVALPPEPSPRTPPPPSVEKLSSTKPVPGAKKVGDCCSRTLQWLRTTFVLSEWMNNYFSQILSL